MEITSQSVKIFISYSRKDKIFARKLNAALKEAGVNAWVDWEGIPLSADWMKEITAGIEGADAFVFIISPDSLGSKVCTDELELGIKYNKKIVPVLYREPEKKRKIHPKLASTNWVYLRSKKDDFKTTIPKLVEAIQTDLEWTQQHTRILQRATEWDNKKRNNSYILQGTDLEEGEHWMTESTAKPGRNAVPLQAEYISTSRQVAVKRQRNLTIGVGAALVLSIFMGIYAFKQSIEARKSRDQAVASENIAKANEQARATQQAIAEEQKKIADANAQEARAQRSAAQANIYLDKVGELYTSTLLAVDAYQQMPNQVDAENTLRHNINLLPIPVSQINVNARIWTIELSSDREKFVTSDSNGKACVWSMEDGSQFFCAQHEGIVYDSYFNTDDSILATGTDQGVLSFWDVKTGKLISSLQFEGSIWDLKLHPSGEWLGVGRTNAISLIDMKRLKEAIHFAQNGEVISIDFDDTGAYMGMGTSKGYVTVWRVMSKQSIAGPKHNSDILDISFSKDGKWLISSGADSTVRASLITSGGQKYSITQGDWVEDVTFGPDSSWFATASDDNTIRVIDTATGQEKLRMTHANFAQKVRVSSDGQWIASTGYDKTARIWDSATGAEVMQVPIPSVGSSIRFSKDSTRLIVGDYDGNITLWDISKLKARKGFIQFSEFSHKAVFSPNGEWLAINSDDKNIWLINSDQIGNIEDNRKILTTAKGLTYDMVISPDSNWIAAVEYDSNIADYNRTILISADGQNKHFLSHNNDIVETAVFTPDSKQVITTDQNGDINIWDVESGEVSYSLQVDGIVLSMAVSPDGKYLAAGMEENNYSVVWDLTTKTQIATLEQIGRINSVQFNKDGKLLATGSSEGTIYLWNVENGAFQRTKNDLPVNGEVLSMNFSPDNQILAVGDDSGYAYLFDLALYQEVIRLPHIDKVSSVAFSPDGTQLAVVSRKTVMFWDIPGIPHILREELVETACAHLIYNFDEIKWKFFFFEEEYRLICPNLAANGN